MSFLYPIGLLGLIGIPILIIIYIIKSKYTEQTVASTYLWTLSERFLKRKNPISRITGIISLVLQILAVVAISFAIAHPVFTLKGLANEYCFILDASGSMQIVEEGTSRFDQAKEKIANTIEAAADGSSYTLIYMGDTTNFVYENLTNKKEALARLKETRVSDVEAEEGDALALAQKHFEKNPSTLTYLATDVNYGVSKGTNLTFWKIGKVVDNCALKDVTCSFSGGKLTVNGFVKSYKSSKSVTLELYVDNFTAPLQTAIWMANSADAAGSPFALTCNAEGYSKIKVVIREEDALAEDNEVILYNAKASDDSEETAYKTLIVSDEPYFIKNAIVAASNATVHVKSTKEYNGETGYGLYIFQNYSPTVVPKDGTVWFINPESQIAGAGFTVQDPEVKEERGAMLQPSTSTSSTVQSLFKNLLQEKIYVAEYVKCGLYRGFTTLFEYNKNPIIFTGSNSYGNREVVFAFDINDSNIALLSDFVTLVRNLFEYSFPQFLDKTFFYVGEELIVNTTANCESVKVQTPDGNVEYLDIGDTIGKMKLTETGVYNVTISVAGTPRTLSVFVAFPEEERSPYVPSNPAEFALQGEAKTGGQDGIYDNLLILFILLAVIFAADWVVYCYEKYQLR